MKAIVGIIVAGLLLTACDKENFETKPRIEIISSSPDVVNVGQPLRLTMKFFDKEGDMDDSLLVIRKRLNERDISIRNPFPIPLGIPKFPDKSQGEIDVTLTYALHLTVTSTAIPLPGNRSEPDTLRLSFVAKDAAGNYSDTVTLDKDIVVIR